MSFSFGQGSVSRSSKIFPTAPPFPGNSAYNGLSVDPITGQIVLGQDIADPLNPAILVSNREIPLAGNDLNLNNAIDYGLGTPAQQGNIFANLLFGPPGGSYAFTIRGAQNDGVTNAMEFTVTKHGFQVTDDVNGTPINILTADNLSIGSDNGLSLAPPVYKIGDVNLVGNSSIFELNDLTGIAKISDATDIFFQADMINQRVALGDVSNVINTTFAAVDVLNKQVQIQAANNGLSQSTILLSGDNTMASSFISMAAFETPATSLQILIDASNDKVSVANSVNKGMLFDYGTDQYQIGDIVGFANGNRFIVDELNSLFIFENIALNSAIQINGVNGFTGTVTPVNSITVNGGIVTAVS